MHQFINEVIRLENLDKYVDIVSQGKVRQSNSLWEQLNETALFQKLNV